MKGMHRGTVVLFLKGFETLKADVYGSSKLYFCVDVFLSMCTKPTSTPELREKDTTQYGTKCRNKILYCLLFNEVDP